MLRSMLGSGANTDGVRSTWVIFIDSTCRFPTKDAGPVVGRNDDVENALTCCCKAAMAVCSSMPLTWI